MHLDLGTDPDGLTEPARSSPSLVSYTESDMRRLGLGPRSSSPAKRSASERDEDDDAARNFKAMDVDAVGSPRSPKKSYYEHTSPMPNRFKPMDEVQNGPRGTSIDMLEEDENVNVHGPRRAPESGGLDDPRPDVRMSNTIMASSPQTSMENDIGPSKTSANLPTLDEQVKIIKELSSNSPLQEGGKGFVISNRWLNRVQSRTTQGVHETFEKSAREGEIGPVDNSDIALNNHFYGDLKDGADNTFVPLLPSLSVAEDFEILPPEAWALIIQWYGVAETSHVISRYVRNTSPSDAISKNLQYELFPPIFTIQKLRNESEGLTHAAMREKDSIAPHLVASRSDGFQSFLTKAKTAAQIDQSTKVKVWKLSQPGEMQQGRSGMPTPMSSRSNSPMPQSGLPTATPKLVVDLNAFTSMAEGQREMVDVKDETANEKYNGHLTLGSVGFPEQQTLILEEQVRGSGDEFVSDKMSKTAAQNGINLSPGKERSLIAQGLAKPKSNTGNARRSPTPSGIMTRGRANKKGKTRGSTGLTNLGNTCYMNSALQCIRSVEELSIYFLEGRHKEEINSGNPLGYGGAIAKTYEGFLTAIYDSASPGSFAPRNFKNTLGRCQPLFSGYGQQDSQEFLSFLVDGLHEDLNRVVKKPYRENPESDDSTVHDPQAIKQLGEKYRDNHRARNDSVAMDLFSGFYKNTMVCPICDKVSVTFDPFSLLTLQLPIESTFQHCVAFAPLRKPLVNINVDMDKNGNISMLKEYVAKRNPGVKAENLIMAEMYNYKLYKVFEDTEVLSEAGIQQNDKLIVYELDAPPTNWPPRDKRKTKGTHSYGHKSSADDVLDVDPQLYEKLAVPVLHRLHENNRSELILWPSMVIITREEAKDVESIFRKVLQRVSMMTTRDLTPGENYLQQSGTSGESEDEILITNDENAPSSDDRKVLARSVEGEDELVDVTMTDASNSPASEAKGSNSKVEPQPPSASAKLLDREYYIEPELRNLFTMSYYSSKDDTIPCGFSSVNAGDRFPLLDSRVLQPPSPRQSAISWNGRALDRQSPGTSDDELSRDDSAHGILGVSNSSPPSDSDENSTTTNESISRGVRSRFKVTRPFGRKPAFKANTKKLQRRSSSNAPPQNEHIIRYGEGIILDWNRDGYNQLFDGTGEDDLRGRPTYENMSTLDDPELEVKKARRAARKRTGVTLEECFEETSKSEILSEENAWFCGRCKELRRATKTLEIWTVPDILVVHLKRFSSSSRLRDKVDVLVDFPTEGLDLTGKVGLPEDKSLTYDLFAVDNHYGGLGGGHYTAYAQNFFDKKWYEYNDSMVSQSSPQQAITKAAYLLFYRRRSGKSLGPPYLQQIVTDAYTEPDQSQSGEDQRRDDSSSPNGSSDSSLEVGAEANHHEDAQPLLGLAGGQRDLESTAKTALNRSDQPPAYGNHSYDEGIGGMDDDPDDPLPGYEDQQQRAFIGPLAQDRFAAPSWGFEHLADGGGAVAPPGSDNMEDSETLAGSNAPEVGESLQDRMHDFDSLQDRMHDFADDEENGDEVYEGPEAAFRLTPDLDDEPYANVTVVKHVEHVEQDEHGDSEGEVAEVRVSDEEGP